MQTAKVAVAGALCVVALVLLAPRMFGARVQPGELTAPPAAAPVELTDGVALVDWAKGLSRPLAMVAQPGDPGRLWVAEKTGTVRVLGTNGALVAGGPVLDLTGKVAQASEQGLLGLAMHPDFAANRLFYVHYNDLDGNTHVGEWRATPGAGGPAERVRKLLYVRQPFSNHNGGHLVVGPDGHLWVGLGDGGASGDPQDNGQDPSALLGKMLRLDLAAAQPAAKIALLGLRNPWRYSFDRKTGDLYLGDVGQNRFEEVDVLAAGTTSGNLGWNEREGYACYEPRTGCKSEGMIPPVVTYRTGHDGCTVVGGHVYRGKALPQLEGTYFYADHCTGMLRSFRWSAAEPSKVKDHFDWKPALDPRDRLASITSFAEDADGELYVLSLDGTIKKLVPQP